MSRAALWRQEGNVKERERRAEELFQTAVQEGRNRKSALPIWGDNSPNEINSTATTTTTTTFHWNPVLLRNTIQSPYFQKCCTSLLDWNAVVDEIYYQVQHVQPFSVAHQPTSPPSTAFCLLLRLLTLRMTEHQLQLTLQHPDSPYIRAIGFLYVRYAGPPSQVWNWIQPYLYDEQELQVEANPHTKAATTTTTTTTANGSPYKPIATVGDFVRHVFQTRDYYGTPLPRFPGPVERDLQVHLLQAEKVVERAARHLAKGYYASSLSSSSSSSSGVFRIGASIMALYGDDENPLTWYPAVIDRIIAKHEQEGYAYHYPRLVVTFTEYGNTETVHLGEIDVLDGEWQRDPLVRQQGGGRTTNHRGTADRGPQHYKHTTSAAAAAAAATTSTAEDYLYEEVRRRERENVTADKGWARRPPTTKDSLSASNFRRGDVDRGGERGYRGDRPRNHHSHRSDAQGGPPTHARRGYQDQPPAQGGVLPPQSSSVPAPAGAEMDPAPSRKRTPEELAAIAEKKRRLLAKYG